MVFPLSTFFYYGFSKFRKKNKIKIFQIEFINRIIIFIIVYIIFNNLAKRNNLKIIYTNFKICLYRVLLYRRLMIRYHY